MCVCVCVCEQMEVLLGVWMIVDVNMCAVAVYLRSCLGTCVYMFVVRGWWQ